MYDLPIPKGSILQSAFACATAPLCSLDRLLSALVWVWAHQLMCNVSNQARTHLEDAMNKPWRPLPAGRITEPQALVLRWVTVVAAFGCSALHGGDLMLTTLCLFLTTFAYDELGLAGHHIGKSFCNIGGYTTFEIGATKLMGPYARPSLSDLRPGRGCQKCFRLTITAVSFSFRSDARVGQHISYRSMP